MFDHETSTEDVSILLAEDAKTTLREEAVEVPVCLRSIPAPTWVFIGKYAMPNSEHLIPFQT